MRNRFICSHTAAVITAAVLGCSENNNSGIINVTQLNLVDSSGKVVAQLKVDNKGPDYLFWTTSEENVL